jgi:hypothetical protein
MKVITHSGGAHADDIMAIALLSVHFEVDPIAMDIVRVSDCDPEALRKAEFDRLVACDPCAPLDFYVLDVGKRHEPSLGFFDHHQFAADAPADCAFSLLARHLGYSDKDFPWMKKMAFLDSKGPYAYFREKVGRKHQSQQELKDLLGDGDSVFEYIPRVANLVPDSMTQFRKAVGMAVDWLSLEVDWIRKRAQNVEFARANMKVIDLGSFKMVYFNQKETKGTLELCDELAAGDPAVIMTGKLDERGAGFSAMRLADNARVDFSKREGEPGCVFAHKNGFVLKWKADWDGYLDALKRSVV